MSTFAHISTCTRDAFVSESLSLFLRALCIDGRLFSFSRARARRGVCPGVYACVCTVGSAHARARAQVGGWAFCAAGDAFRALLSPWARSPPCPWPPGRGASTPTRRESLAPTWLQSQDALRRGSRGPWGGPLLPVAVGDRTVRGGVPPARLHLLLRLPVPKPPPEPPPLVAQVSGNTRNTRTPTLPNLPASSFPRLLSSLHLLFFPRLVFFGFFFSPVHFMNF